MAGHSSLWVERFDRADAILNRLVAELREASAVGELIYPLAARSHLSFRLGRWPAAHADAAEAVRLGEATGQEQTLSHALGALAEVEAALGNDDDARRHATRAVTLAQAQGADAVAAYGHGALALLASGRREPEEALERALAAERAEARTDDDEPGIVRYAPDMLEALWRLGREEEAGERLAKLERQADRPGHTWAQAVVARIRGLLGENDEIDGHFAAALSLHQQTPQPFEAARTRLLYGERLRRARRRSDARPPLREALAIFERLGAAPWVDRARAELLATGGQEAAALTAVNGGGEGASAGVSALTPQELQIALHAARGMTNREVGAALFLAPKTVEHHLSRSFRKLGIRRRVELAGALGPALATAA
jgi:ATP/maltotriose-dependent transcriptional regulator MalT